jgi:gluconokinase
MKIVVMGVSGAGKSTLGAALAAAIGSNFLDADDFHTEVAKAKIASGVALDETDRAAWLMAILPHFNQAGQSTVLACSALKEIHRESLAPDVLVHLVIDMKLAIQRLSQRRGHFAGPSIAPSQFAILEAPDTAIEIPAHWPTKEQVRFIQECLECFVKLNEA